MSGSQKRFSRKGSTLSSESGPHGCRRTTQQDLVLLDDAVSDMIGSRNPLRVPHGQRAGHESTEGVGKNMAVTKPSTHVRDPGRISQYLNGPDARCTFQGSHRGTNQDPGFPAVPPCTAIQSPPSPPLIIDHSVEPHHICAMLARSLSAWCAPLEKTMTGVSPAASSR